MLPVHTRYVKNFIIQQRISLLLGIIPAKSNNSQLQSLNLDIIKLIIHYLGTPNSNDVRIVKANGLRTCMAHLNQPSMLWLLTFLKISDIPVFRSWIESVNNTIQWSMCMHEIVMKVRDCNYWSKATRWYLEGCARHPHAQILVTEINRNAHDVRHTLNGIFGYSNVQKYFCIRGLNDDNTQIIICSPLINKYLLENDIVLRNFCATIADDRVIPLHEYKPGFVLTL